MVFHIAKISKLNQAAEYAAQGAPASCIQELAGRDKKLVEVAQNAFRVAAMIDSNDLASIIKYLEELKPPTAKRYDHKYQPGNYGCCRRCGDEKQYHA